MSKNIPLTLAASVPKEPLYRLTVLGVPNEDPSKVRLVRVPLDQAVYRWSSMSMAPRAEDQDSGPVRVAGLLGGLVPSKYCRRTVFSELAVDPTR